MKVAIIEPHYDDCWLNIGGLLLTRPDHEYRVITVSKDDNWGNNVNKTEAISNYLSKFSSISLDYDSLDVNREKMDAQVTARSLSGYEGLFLDVNCIKSSHEVLDRIKSLISGYDVLFMPLGVNHPMHVVIGQWDFDIPTFKYQEYPYSFYEEEQEKMRSVTENMPTYNVDITNVVKDKVRLFKEIYPEQQFILDLPECKTRLESLTQETFYSKIDRGALWKQLV